MAVYNASLPTLVTGQQNENAVDINGRTIVALQDQQGAAQNITTQNLNPTSGVPTANSTASITPISGASIAAIQVTGTWTTTGGLIPQITLDGTNWVAILELINGTTQARVAAIPSAAVGLWFAFIPATAQFRVSANGAVTGTAVCTVRSSIGELNTVNAISTAVVTSLANSVALATNLVIKASAGRLYNVQGYNSRTSSQFIQVHNAASLPADTAVPVATFIVPATSNFSLDFGALGIPLSTGIVLCNSSTAATKTIGSADIFATAAFV